MADPSRPAQPPSAASETAAARAAHVGSQIRAARLASGRSLRGLAADIHVSPATLSQIERGRTRLSVDRLAQIADALGIQPIAILAEPGGEPASATAASVTLPEPPPGQPDRPEPADWRSYGPLRFDPVLAAALSQFLRAGYHGASVRDIARASHLSVPGLYHHHASKQDMLHQILLHTMTDLLARAEAAVAEGADAVQRFCLLVECLALYHTHRRDLAFVGASEMRSLEPANRQQIAAMRITVQRMLDREVVQAASEGRFTVAEPRAAARAVTSMCVALANWFRADGPRTPEQIAVQYVGFALGTVGHVARGGQHGGPG